MPVDFDGVHFYEATDDNSIDATPAVNMPPVIDTFVRNAERSSEPAVHLMPLTYDTWDRLIDDELAQVRKRKEILELKPQIRQHDIIKFAGDDRTQDINLFIRDFEQLMSTLRADESFNLLSRSLKVGSAAAWLLGDTSAVNYLKPP